MYILFFITNFICYFLLLKLGFLFFKNKYVFPFRIADLFGLTISIIIFTSTSYMKFNFETAFVTFLININFFLIFFFVLSMINTSPRTKILLDLFKKKKIKKKKYLQYYNADKIVNNRIKRFLTNKEIIFKKNAIKINSNDKRMSLLKLIIFVYKSMKKF